MDVRMRNRVSVTDRGSAPVVTGIPVVVQEPGPSAGAVLLFDNRADPVEVGVVALIAGSAHDMMPPEETAEVAVVLGRGV